MAISEDEASQKVFRYLADALKNTSVTLKRVSQTEPGDICFLTDSLLPDEAYTCLLSTSLDHVGVVARREGISLMLDRVNQLSGGLPVIVTGDFNSEPESDVIKHVTDPANPEHLTDARLASPVVYGPAWSFHDFGKIPYQHRPLIDYVFCLLYTSRCV